MKCPVCHENTIYVSGTVNMPADYTHRYVRCSTCGSTFQTVETIIPGTLHEKFYADYQPDIFKTATENGKNKKSA